jgi:hypothetical protein
VDVRPSVLVTRKLPAAVETRLLKDYQPILNVRDEIYSRQQLLELAADVDAIVPCHTERMDAEPDLR